MTKILYNPSVIHTVNSSGTGYRRGRMMHDIQSIKEHSVVISGERISAIVPNNQIDRLTGEIIDCTGKMVTPGLIDSHTHLVFAGSRSNEFKLKLSGASYEEIAASGGGIKSTVAATRRLEEPELFKLAERRVLARFAEGVTTLEIKSGYGLEYETELKMLRVIKQLKEKVPFNILATFLGAHTLPVEFSSKQDYINFLIDTVLPEVTRHKLADYCDAFCEKSAFQPDELQPLYDAASLYKLPLKIHSDQFYSIGGTEQALQSGALSVDHLEALPPEKCSLFTRTETVATVLPAVSFYLNCQYAPARELINNDAILSIASDYNPGSAHIADFSFAMYLAAKYMKLSFEEILTAVTLNAAHSLGIGKVTGSIEAGKLADITVFSVPSLDEYFYNYGEQMTFAVITKGRVHYQI